MASIKKKWEEGKKMQIGKRAHLAIAKKYMVKKNYLGLRFSHFFVVWISLSMNAYDFINGIAVSKSFRFGWLWESVYVWLCDIRWNCLCLASLFFVPSSTFVQRSHNKNLGLCSLSVFILSSQRLGFYSTSSTMSPSETSLKWSQYYFDIKMLDFCWL